MTSLASVPAGLLMVSDVALRAVPVLALAAPWNMIMIAPGQVSATSHSFAAARQTAPALPGGCWQLVLVPSHLSVVQGSPSSGQGAPAALAAWVSAGLQGRKASAGQVGLAPVQVSATSHGPAAARQTAPALPAGCWQLVLVPLHWSRVHGLPSSVHAVPAAFTAPVSAGHVLLVPVQVSGRSHSPAAARQMCELSQKVQLFLQQEPDPFNAPISHCSPESTVPSPQVPEASVNVVSAVRPEESPVAVSVNVTPMSKTATMKSAFLKSQFASATEVSWRSGSNGGSSCRIITTVSPGVHPLPVMATVWPT